MIDLWRQLRETFFYPLLYTLLPAGLKHRLLGHVENHAGLYASQVQAMQMALPRYIPQADVQECARQLRLIHLIDHSDVFTSLLRFRHGLAQCSFSGAWPSRGSLILGGHRANGWWILPALAHQGLPAHFISAPLIHPSGWVAAILKPYRLVRWRLLNRLGRAAVIPMRGAVQASREALLGNAHVVALIDLPTQIVRHTHPVEFLGRTAYMPSRLIEMAMALQRPIYYCTTRLSRPDLRMHIELVPLHGDHPAAVFQAYASLLERDIRCWPGSWHCWGHVDLFFEGPSHPAVT
jgi:hypothetical protein